MTVQKPPDTDAFKRKIWYSRAPVKPTALDQVNERAALSQLALIYAALQAVRTLGVIPRRDERLNDTMQVVDQLLSRASEF